jgi:hypothetical protein
MSRHLILLVLMLAGGLMSGADASAATLTLTSTATGKYASDGSHLAASANYAVGQTGGTVYHDFFAFDVPSGETILGASLLVPALGYLSIRPNENVVLYDVSMPVSTLTATQTSATSIFDDLGSGDIFAVKSVTAADDNTFVTFSLNSSAVASLVAAMGASWAIGGAITPLLLPAGSDELVFASSVSVGAELVLQIVPEPPAIALAAIGALGLANVANRSRRVRRRRHDRVSAVL